ncbi:MAG: glycosyltransferase family 2 protein [Candidatus Gastranaerophilales bacterium]|nr:glycosyltransferase family 2 protein [Candidatus Gastranaerophilales bacterium]
MNCPKISVIIPVYNVEKYLAECLDSVINQTLKEIEILCVNDGSTDASAEIIEQYAKKDERIKVFNQENKGAGSARNVGIKQAQGDFLAFLDSDDVYPSNDVLEVLFNSAKENKVLIAGGEFAYLENGSLKTEYLETEDGFGFIKEGIIKYQDYQFDYGYYRFIYDRKFIIKNNFLFPTYARFQDPPFFVRTMFEAKEFYAIKKLTYAFRIEHKELKWNSKKANDALCAILDNFKFASENNLDKLNNYTFERLKQHIDYSEKEINFGSILILNEMKKYNRNIEKLLNEKKISFSQICALPVLRWVFSLKNSEDKKHKVLTFFGVRVEVGKV